MTGSSDVCSSDLLRRCFHFTSLKNRDTDVENKCMDTKVGKGVEAGGGGMNWEIRFDINTLPCVK